MAEACDEELLAGGPLLRYALRRGLPILVGEAPSRTGDRDPTRALTGKSGRRLADLAGLRWPAEYLRRFGRVNLLLDWPGQDGDGSLFDGVAAAPRARALGEVAQAWRSPLVLLGRRVAACFGRGDAPWFRPSDAATVHDGPTWRTFQLRSWVVPHPSGASRWWNSPDCQALAAAFLTRLARAARDGAPLE